MKVRIDGRSALSATVQRRIRASAYVIMATRAYAILASPVVEVLVDVRLVVVARDPEPHHASGQQNAQLRFVREGQT